MKDWIEKNIDPPGLEKKSRGSLFSLIGRVFGIVKNDAVKAFNAFFPYLSDPEKLKEHGLSLSVPELPYDDEEEFRDRVSTASFYLMRAGERAYIREQLQAHFGENYLLKEEFLKVYINIPDLNDADRSWVRSLLDGLLDPNISLTVAEWFHYIDTMTMQEALNIRVKRKDFDFYPPYSLRYDGRIYCDQGREVLCNGDWECNGLINCDRFMPARGTTSDYLRREVCADGTWICDGQIDCKGYQELFSPLEVPGFLMPAAGCGDEFGASLTLEPMEDRLMIRAVCDGTFLCDGSNTKPIIDAPMRLRIIKELRCNGVKKPSCSVCDGTIICDGSYGGYDGLYYTGDIIQEEVL
jgi:hypothetical protein